MGFSFSVGSAFSNYNKFEGRSRRSEFWWFYLFTLLCSCAPFLALVVWPDQYWLNGAQHAGQVILTFPLISVGVRRLHDVDKSGWNQLLLLTIVGIIPLVWWLARPGLSSVNRFGPSPNAKVYKKASSIFSDEALNPSSDPVIRETDFDKLEKLAALYKSGALSEAEFVQQKGILLNRRT